MPKRITKTRVVSDTNSSHVLSIGQLKSPIGGWTGEQLESGVGLVTAAQLHAESSHDELAKKRLALDLAQLKAELERREFSAA